MATTTAASLRSGESLRSGVVFCPQCNAYTKTSEPVLIRRQEPEKFHIRGLCAGCKWTKSMYLPHGIIRALPNSFNALRLKYNFMNYVDIDGEMVELFPILDPLIN